MVSYQRLSDCLAVTLYSLNAYDTTKDHEWDYYVVFIGLLLGSFVVDFVWDALIILANSSVVL